MSLPSFLHRLPVHLVLAAALLSSSCAPARGVEPVAPPASAAATDPAAGTLSNAEIEALYRARMEAARTRFTAADVDFMTGMIHHHAQAVEMAMLAPRNEAGVEVRTLAARILNSQRDEIALMQRWLEDREQPVPVLHVTDEGVRVHEGAPHAGQAGGAHGGHGSMPGMLTPDQLASLAAARGPDFDRLFLTLMIEHHRGAVTMVHDLFATDGAAQDDAVFRLASDVQVDQLTEVARMEAMLERLDPGGGAP
jgi:uncharacterized protein (DUF305 family)